jgi:hypothetical protein
MAADLDDIGEGLSTGARIFTNRVTTISANFGHIALQPMVADVIQGDSAMVTAMGTPLKKSAPGCSWVV